LTVCESGSVNGFRPFSLQLLREAGSPVTRCQADLKIIYCSGYADNLPDKDSPLRNNEDFLEKPFEPVKLLQKVQNCADGKS
jgi:CheY-like chemotaxis protein